MSALRVGPLWRSIEGTGMKRTNQMQMYRLGNLTRLRELDTKTDMPQRLGTMALAEIYLQQFVDDPLNPDLVPRAVERAAELLAEIKKPGTPNTANSISYVELLLSRFETSLEDDLTRLPTYLIERVGAYSIDQLIASAENVFPEKMRRKGLIPDQAILDFKSAGACLAYDLPTACGFHVYRATDAMLREYCKHFNAVPSGNSRDWGTFIRELKKVVLDSTVTKKPNERTVELIDSIRSQDRNPLVHPELNLDSDGALLMFDLCKNAVSLMAIDIRNSP